MTRRSTTILGLFTLIATAISPGLAWAQSTNAKPDLAKTEARFDPSRIAALPETGKTAASDAAAKLKSGELQAFVFAASPDMKVWALSGAAKGAQNPILADVARTALETCELRSGGACAILSVDGFEAARKGGAYVKQPEMLMKGPSLFDSETLPFMSAADRSKTSAYQKAQGPRAFAITPSGGWIWRNGPNVVQAIEKTMADCAARFKDVPCVLYAVNDRVEFGSK